MIRTTILLLFLLAFHAGAQTPSTTPDDWQNPLVFEKKPD
jgi:hypothetical protein